MSNISFKDIDISVISDLSNDFILNNLGDSLSLYDKLSNEYLSFIDKTEPKFSETVRNETFEFLIDYFICKYLDIEYKSNNDENLQMLKVIKLYEFECELDSHINTLNQYFLENKTVSMENLVKQIKNKSYLLEKKVIDNQRLLLNNYNDKSNSFSNDYNNINSFSNNDTLNIKLLMSKIEENPSYLANVNKFSNLLFNYLKNNTNPNLDFNLNNKYDKSREIENKMFNHSEFKLNIDEVINISINKYIGNEFKNFIDNRNSNIREMLLNKITSSITSNQLSDDPEDNDKPSTIVFSFKNLDYLFKNIDVFSDEFDIRPKT